MGKQGPPLSLQLPVLFAKREERKGGHKTEPKDLPCYAFIRLPILPIYLRCFFHPLSGPIYTSLCFILQASMSLI